MLFGLPLHPDGQQTSWLCLFVWEFILAFGEEFTVEDTHLGKAFKTIDDYYDHPNGWHIKLSVYEKDENRFYAFLEEFCKKRDLLFRDPRTEEK